MDDDVDIDIVDEICGARDTAAEPKVPKQSEAEQSMEKSEPLQSVEIRFITPEDENVPDSLAPPDLIKAIERGRVKYLYCGQVDEEIILQLIKEGEINTLRNPIKKVDKSAFQKVRNGQQERGSGERHKKRVQKR